MKRMLSTGSVSRRCLRVSPVDARLASGGAYLRVGDSDKDSVETIATVKALQGALRVPQTGKIDVKTSAALTRAVGPDWPDRTYMGILQDVRRQRGGSFTSRSALSGDFWGYLGAGEVPYTMSGSTAVATTADGQKAFARLQAEANRSSGWLGFTPLALDGKIGTQTAKTVLEVANHEHAADQEMESLRMALLSAGASPSFVAQNAQGLTGLMADVADGRKLAAAAPLVAKTSTLPAVDVAAMARQQQASSTLTDLLPYAALAVAGYLLLTPKRSKK